MINLISGRPGGGKSYEAVAYHVIPAIKEGRKVITNLPLNLKVIEKVFGAAAIELITVITADLHDYGNANRPFSIPDHYKDDWRNEKGQGALVIVDECHMIIPARGCAVELLEFLSMHRHFGIDIIFITQSNKKIHRDVRDMVELEYRCIKATALGSNDKYIKKIHMGCNGSVVNEDVREYDKTFFPFYQSHTASNKSVQEATAKDVKPFYKHWLFYFFIVLCFAFIYGIYNIATATGSLGGETKPREIEQVQAPVLPDGVPTNDVPMPEVKEKVDTSHPLQIFDLQPSGYADFTLKTKQGSGNHHSVFIDLMLDGELVHTLTSDDLAVMGYAITPLTECVYSVKYNDIDLGVRVCKIRKQDTDNSINDVIKDFNPLA